MVRGQTVQLDQCHQELQAAGHDVVTLPNGLRGARPTPPSSGSTSTRSTIRCARRAFVWRLRHHERGDGRENVKALVYVDAFIPDEGQNAAVLASQESVLTAALTDPTKVFKLVPIPGAPPDVLDTYLLPEVVSSSFANDVSAEEAKLIHATQRPASLAGSSSRPDHRPGRRSRRGP